MTKGKHEEGIPAKIVDLDADLDPVPATIVADSRRLLGRRLGIFALALLLLFFVINAYIQSVRNGEALQRASKDRSSLVKSIERNSKTLEAQTTLIKQLQTAIRIQNKLLRDAGIKTVPVPGENTTNNIFPTPQPTPGPTPEPEPSSSASPDPIPSSPPEDIICSLTGICLNL